MLALLWIAFLVVSMIAFFAILVTGRYPRPLFGFNVGVLRWTWRVHYYGYGALGTDRYPRAPSPTCPATRRTWTSPTLGGWLSRGLVLVKWWLLALPHYLVLSILVGGGLWASSHGIAHGSYGGLGAGGLLVLIGAIVLLFTARNPKSLYALVVGIDRWLRRVAAYAALMTDAYPPFRLDQGGTDPGTVPARPAPPVPAQ